MKALKNRGDDWAHRGAGGRLHSCIQRAFFIIYIMPCTGVLRVLAPPLSSI